MNVHQDILVRQLKLIFPNEKPHVNARKESQIKNEAHYLELDVWFPNLNICFEFQDSYHYVTTWYNQKSQNQVHSKDKNKVTKLLNAAIRLILVPCWWNGSQESLSATINFQCPDLVPESNEPPISLNPPLDFFKINEVPEVGELMYVSFPSDNIIIRQNTWWLGEKYDGIRGCWNPYSRKVYSRHGNEFELLPQLTTLMPKIITDGEFWFGRGLFSLTFSFVNKIIDFIAWDLLRNIVFDYPVECMQDKSFEERYFQLTKNITSDNPFVFVAPRFLWNKIILQLNPLLNMITEQGGEGIVMRKVNSFYEHGRSSSLLKLKSSNEDMEGIVVAVNQKQVQLQLPNGEILSVPPENVPIKVSIGEIVTFSYERTKPYKPLISRVRTDISWNDLASYLHYDVSFSKHIPLETSSMRLFMEKFAKKRNLNPFSRETWQKFTDEDLGKEKIGRLILRKYSGYANAVCSLFPELNLDKHAFSASFKNEILQRREFFENFARVHGFDPLVPENWYSQSRQKIVSMKGGESILFHYGNVSKALIDLFPEIGLQARRWTEQWDDPKRRRKFFENYAKENNFDPLIPENWYSQSRKNLLGEKGAHSVMSFHDFNIFKALVDLFPEINFNTLKLLPSWQESVNRRIFFENLAKEKGFDPLNPENWYHLSREDIIEVKGATRVISYHNNNFSKTLQDLFPEIGLKQKLWTSSWQEKAERRIFFENFAKENGFDPLQASNWYYQSRKKILLGGAYGIIGYYKNNISKALLDLFPDIGLESSKLSL